MYNLWRVALIRQNFMPTRFSFLCSFHFKSSDYISKTSKPRLKMDAIPSIFSFPKHLQKSTVTPRHLSIHRRCIMDEKEAQIKHDQNAANFGLQHDHTYCSLDYKKDMLLYEKIALQYRDLYLKWKRSATIRQVQMRRVCFMNFFMYMKSWRINSDCF